MASSSVISLSSITKSFGSRILFDEVSITFQPGHRYGLTGPNGAGKSTLLRIITGEEDPTRGNVSLPDRVGILRQNIDDFAENKVLDVVLMGNERLWNALQERERLYGEEITDEVGMRLAELEAIVGEEDGYSAEAAAESLLMGIGIELSEHGKQLKHLPTDIQFRVLLCQALFGAPQALLLDEPTNHLDLHSIGWLEDFLHEFSGVLIVISHDRHFLNSVTTHIADIDYETIIVYPGNYDDMVLAKSAMRSRAESEVRSREKKIARLKEYIQKFGAGSRASRVKSREKAVEKLKPQELKASNIQRPYIRFTPTEERSGQVTLRAKKLEKTYSDKRVIDPFSLEVLRGEKVGIVGNNGLGKTTLLKMLAQQLTPDGGETSFGHNVVPSYFPQEHSDLVSREDTSTIFDWLRARKEGVTDEEIRSVLGRMLFSGDDAFKQVGSLSGGETARLIMAGLMLTPSNLLLLDEPHNHLDLEAVSALGEGLEAYPGSVLFVSHDRDLVARVATRIIAFEGDSITQYSGRFEEYVAKTS